MNNMVPLYYMMKKYFFYKDTKQKCPVYKRYY